MDFLNNVNVVISIFVGLFALGAYIISIIVYFRHKIASSQQQTIQPQPTAQKNITQAAPKSLSKLDWMEVLWTGLEDSFRAKRGWGWFYALMICIFGGFITSEISPLVCSLFLIVFSIFILSFYGYFVGRRIEKKVKAINDAIAKVDSPALCVLNHCSSGS